MNEPRPHFKSIVADVPEQSFSSHDAERLWTRIADTHRRRRRQQRVWRACGSSVTVLAALGVGVFATGWTPARHAQIDWQARAQALELQLDTIDPHASGSASASFDASLRSSLSRIDGALQAAYDRGAPESELTSLWKRRSEVLNTLLVARRGHLTQI